MLGYHLESYLEANIGCGTSYKESSSQEDHNSKNLIRSGIYSESIRKYQGYKWDKTYYF